MLSQVVATQASQSSVSWSAAAVVSMHDALEVGLTSQPIGLPTV